MSPAEKPRRGLRFLGGFYTGPRGVYGRAMLGLRTSVACVVAWCSFGALAAGTAHAQEAAVQRPAVRDTLGLRAGFLGSGLFDSGQGRPFVYLDTGLRYKAELFYIDLRLPALIGGLDYAQFLLQGAIGVPRPFNLFEGLNEAVHYGAYLEAAHVKIGQTFTLYPWPTDPLRLTVGVFTLAELVFFDLPLANDIEAAGFDSIDVAGARDPFVVAPGGFVALGGDAPSSEYDIALGVGSDVYRNDNYEPASGLVLYADADVQIDVLEDLGIELRTRLSTYTHTKELVFALVTSFGVVFRLL